jgi:hypothetical protein
MPVEAFTGAASARMTDGKGRKKRFGGETPTDAMRTLVAEIHQDLAAIGQIDPGAIGVAERKNRNMCGHVPSPLCRAQVPPKAEFEFDAQRKWNTY